MSVCMSYHVRSVTTCRLFSLLPSCILVYILLSMILFNFRNASCIDLACFRQLHCAIDFLFLVFIQ